MPPGRAAVLHHVDFVGKGAFGVDIFFVISGFWATVGA